jgi:peptide/nickel transport system substrate-binding protein
MAGTKEEIDMRQSTRLASDNQLQTRLMRRFLRVSLLTRMGRQVLFAAAIAASAALLLTAGTASADPPPERILRIELNTPLDWVDPALAYFLPSWQAEQATCARLVNYPDVGGPDGRVLYPEVAAAMPTVSPDGLVYTFTLRGNFTFSPPAGGQPVTAASFKRALERVLTPAQVSPGQSFFMDIVGAQEMINGTATTLSGVVAAGQTLSITLTKPAGDFLARLALPFACPLPPSTPIAPDGIQAPVPSAGPYYIASYSQTGMLIAANPNYGGTRPQRFDEIHYTFGVSLATTRLNIEAGTTDLGDVPPAAHQELDTLYGPASAAAASGHQQWFTHPGRAFRYLAMNHDRPLFGSGGPLGNVNLKKAVNYAIDRSAIVAQYGHKAAYTADQYLAPTFPGFQAAALYPDTPDLATARALAGWSPGDPMTPAVLYTCNTGPCVPVANIVKANLAEIGLDVQIQSFPRAVQFVKAGTRGEPFDLTLDAWNTTTLDSYEVLQNLDGSLLQPANNSNFAYFNDPGYIVDLHAANELSGAARLDALGALDVEVARDAAPLAAYLNDNVRALYARRIGCQIFSTQVGAVNLAALCIRPEIAVDDDTVTESGGTATFTISLASDEIDQVTVNYQTVDGTAVAGQDYVAKNGSVTFDPHQQAKTVSVDLIDDDIGEAAESFSLAIIGATLGTIVDPSGQATIALSDGGPDTVAPTNPALASASHTPSGWSNDNTVAVTWTGASDTGAGVDGFSYLFDTRPATTPDQVTDAEESAGATTSPALTDGNSHWFHLRTRDNAGNWSGAVHLGPFFIDTTSPNDPAASSPSHVPGIPSFDSTIEIAWSGATDASSGIDGFSYLFDTNPATTPDQVKDAEESAGSTTSPSLPAGSHWFHLRTRDNTGNWTATVHVGPFLIANAPTPPPPPLPLPQVGVGATATVSSAGIALLSVSCKGTVACNGSAELFSKAGVRALAASPRIRIGSARFSIPARKTKVVKIRLSPRGKQLMRANRRLRVQLVLTVRNAARSKKISRAITLIAAKRR